MLFTSIMFVGELFLVLVCSKAIFAAFLSSSDSSHDLMHAFISSSHVKPALSRQPGLSSWL